MGRRLSDKFLIWAHRGASAYAPENSMEAFKMAVDMKADGIELDVHLSKDGHIIVIHDAKVDRTSNGTGVVAEMTLEELRAFDYYGKFPEQYSNVKVPTLADVYELIAPTGMVVNVEIKSPNPEIIQKCIDLAKEYKMEDKVIYSSFDHLQLDRLLQINKDILTAPLYSFNMIKPWLYAKTCKASAIHPHYGQIQQIENYVEEHHSRGIRVHAWTVDAPEVMNFLKDKGVDAIITNKPDLAYEVIYKQ